VLEEEAGRGAELEDRLEERETLLAILALEQRLDARRREDLAVQAELELGRPDEDGELDCARR